MACRKYRIAALFALLFSGSVWAANDNYALYSFVTGAFQDSVTIRLDTRTGKTWFFDGEYLKPMREAKTPKRYRNAAYELNPQTKSDGTLLLRIDRVNGSVWVYRQERWQALRVAP